MALLDDRGRLFGKVNVIDLLVLVLLAALVVFVFARFDKTAAANGTIRTTFVIEKLRETSVRQFQMGDGIYDDSGLYLGKVTQRTEVPTVTDVPTATGDLNPAESRLTKDLTLEVTGRGHVSGRSARIGSLPLLVGKFVVIRGPTAEARAQIRDVSATAG